MEGPTQAMLMSHRPVSPPSMNLIDNNRSNGSVGVGNYKGVMLCNRPFGGVSANAATHAMGTGDTQQAFMCGRVSSDIGRSQLPLVRPVAARRPKKQSALQRHRKWLVELQQTKERLEKEFTAAEDEKEDFKRKFMEREAKMRQVARSTLRDACGQPREDKALTPRKADEPSSRVKDEQTHIKSMITEAASRKPMWALTEATAETSKVEAEEQEMDDLLEFAKELDFEKYMGDMEVQAMMERVRKRIQELEDEVQQEEASMRRTEERLTGQNLQNHERKSGSTPREQQEDEQGEDDATDARSVAKTVLSDAGATLKAVHSTKSVAQLALRSKERIQNTSIKTVANDGEVPGEALCAAEEPRIVIAQSADNNRLENQKRVGNLPYLNRNPAV